MNIFWIKIYQKGADDHIWFSLYWIWIFVLINKYWNLINCSNWSFSINIVSTDTAKLKLDFVLCYFEYFILFRFVFIFFSMLSPTRKAYILFYIFIHFSFTPFQMDKRIAKINICHQVRAQSWPFQWYECINIDCNAYNFGIQILIFMLCQWKLFILLSTFIHVYLKSVPLFKHI